MNTLQQKYEILSSSKCGIEFEFYTELSPKELVKSLSFALGKKVTIPVVVKGLGETSKGAYHSDLEPTANLFKLERDFSGGKDMFELITGPMIYEEARLVIIKMNQWIKQNGWTDQKSAIHLNVSFDKFKAKTRVPLINLNVLKFILSFDEEFIYKRFPERRDSVYGKSIDNYYPVNRFVFFDEPNNIDSNDYVVPNEKYYGVNFTKLPKQYLEMRYLGGMGYENKTYKILEILDYFVNKLYSCLQQNDIYTPDERDRLFKKLKAQKKAVQSFSDPERFLINYPNIQLTVDMKGDPEIIKAYWGVLREVLFDLIVDSGLREGHLNFDTDVSIFQLRDGKLKKANNVRNMELFDCEISGTIYDSSLYRCEVNSSRMENCKLMETNEVSNSKLTHTTIHADSYLNNCYIDNNNETIDGKVDGGVIRRGIIGRNAQISKHTLIVDATYGDKKDSDSYQDAFKNK